LGELVRGAETFADVLFDPDFVPAVAMVFLLLLDGFGEDGRPGRSRRQPG
jgi:hypothetical protein